MLAKKLRFSAAVLAVTLAVPALADQAEPQEVNRELEGWMVGEFTLVDLQGNAFTAEQLTGRWTFVLLGDTRCGERCTSALAVLAGMVQRIARTEVVKSTQVLFVSLEPARDSTANLRRYLAPYGPRFIGARGNDENRSRLVEDLTSPGSTRGAGRSPGSLLLVGPDRYVRGEFLPPYDVLQLTARFMKTRIGR